MKVGNSSFLLSPFNVKKNDNPSGNTVARNGYSAYGKRDSFTRSNNAATLSFGLLPTVEVETQVVNIEPANKDLTSIQRGRHYNEQTKSLDLGFFSTGDSVDLCLFKKDHDENEVVRIPMIPMKNGDKNTNLWVQSIPQSEVKKFTGADISYNDSSEIVYYGYRARGTGQFSDYQKLLTDDHAWATSHSPVTKGRCEDGSVYAQKGFDTAKVAPKSIYSRKLEKLSKPDSTPRTLKPATDHVIYEAHVRGLTAGLGDILTRKDKIELAKKLKSGNQSLIEKLQLLTPEEIKKAEKKKLAKKLGKKSFELVTENDLKTERTSLARENLKRLYKGTEAEGKGMENEWEDEFAGTYKGATFMIPYFKKMGYTMIEFMPIMEFQSVDSRTSGTNDWGYMTDQFLAPKRDYAFDKNAPEGPTDEFKKMVNAFNNNGMEVCMDVVYNHTGEGGTYENNPNAANIISLRGSADGEYYTRWSGNPQFYSNSSGCGNDTYPNKPAFRELVTNSLKHFRDLGVTAFRFDLARILANSNDSPTDRVKFDPNHPILKEIETVGLKPTDGGRKGIIWIAEPWGGEKWEDPDPPAQGRFPKTWHEWNGHGFRDNIRRAINDFGPGRPAAGTVTDSMCGSDKLINGNGAPRSINFITAHDGFTMYDLFAYNNKHNYSTDGGEPDKNHSWNQYWNSNPNDFYNKNEEGIPHPFSRREKTVKTALSLLMTSAGTPMLLYGDERAHTKFGNNNSYKWPEGNNIDWNATTVNPDENGNEQTINADNLAEFTKNIINFRHDHNALHPDRYYRDNTDGNDYNGKEIAFYDMKGNNISESNQDLKGKFFDGNDEESDVIGVRLDETEFHKESEKEKIKNPTIYMAFNRAEHHHDIKLPRHMIPGKEWYLASDTSVPVTDPNDPTKTYEELSRKPAYKEGEEKLITGNEVHAPGRSMLVFVEK